jgi:hypothetical protein
MVFNRLDKFLASCVAYVRYFVHFIFSSFLSLLPFLLPSPASPLTVLLDLYLHHEDLIARHNLRIPFPSFRPTKIFRVSLQLLWNVTSTPIIGAIWILFLGASADTVYFFSSEASGTFFSVNVICNIILAAILVAIVRRGKPKKKSLEENFDQSRSAYGENDSGSEADSNVIVDNDKEIFIENKSGLMPGKLF